MRRTVKFPALMAAVPPRHTKPKMAICVFDTVVEIPVLSASDMPIAISYDRIRQDKIEYRQFGGRLYRETNKTPERLFKYHAQHVVDTRSLNPVTGAIMRDIRRQIDHVNDDRRDKFWPRDAKVLLKGGMSTEWDMAREIVDGSQYLKLDGSWRADIGKDSELGRLVAEPSQARLAEFEYLTHQAFARFVIVDGKVWEETPEPCYVVLTSPTGHKQCFISDIGRYAATADNAEIKEGWWSDLRYQAFSLAMREHVIDGLASDCANAIPTVDIHAETVVQADMDSLEMGRCARILVREVSDASPFNDRLADRIAVVGARVAKPLPSNVFMNACKSLADLVETYDPLGEVPDELEIALERLLESNEMQKVQVLAPHSVEGARAICERWRNRSIDSSMIAPGSLRP